MRETLHLRAESGLVLLRDATVEVDEPALFDPDREELRRRAEHGELFYLDGEDPVELRLVLAVGEPAGLPPHRSERVGGAFLLRLPSGRLRVGDDAPLEVEPGDYAVTVFQPAVVDAEAIEEERRGALEPEEWRYRRRVEAVAMAGCVPFVAAWIVVFVYGLSMVSLVATILGLLAAAPGYLLSRTGRYRRTEERLREHAAGRPSHALELHRVEKPAGLVGGHLVL